MSSTFSTFIRSRRLELGLTQRFVADRIGLATPDFVSLVEQGRRRLDLDRVPALATALGLEPRTLCAMALAERHPDLCRVLFAERP